MRLSHWVVKEPINRKTHMPKIKGCVILLPGRGIPPSLMLRFFQVMKLKKTLAVALQPFQKRWYPIPNGVNDQHLTIKGLPFATEVTERAIKRIHTAWNIPYEEMILLGFSAGAAVAMDVLTTCVDLPLGGYVSLGGAIFEPNKVKQAWTQAPVILQHGQLDNVFFWDERYIPMRDALQSNGYNVIRIEHTRGRHTLYHEDAENIGKLFAQHLKYTKKYISYYFRRIPNEQ